MKQQQVQQIIQWGLTLKQLNLVFLIKGEENVLKILNEKRHWCDYQPIIFILELNHDRGAKLCNYF